MRCTGLMLAVGAIVTVLFGAPVQANAADVILSGSIKSSAGEAMGGVMVSAKPQGGTITTTVLTDEAGRYYFPPLAAGKYRVWAQTLSFETGKGEIDLGAVTKARLHAQADDRVLPAIARPRHAGGAARGRRAGQAHEAHRAQQLHGLPHRQLRAAAPLRRSRLERHRRHDEKRQCLRHLRRRHPAAGRPARLPPEGACRLSRQGPRSGRERHEGQARAARHRRGGARRVSGNTRCRSIRTSDCRRISCRTTAATGRSARRR